MWKRALAWIFIPMGFFGSVINLIALYSIGELPLNWIGLIGILGMYLWFTGGIEHEEETPVQEEDE